MELISNALKSLYESIKYSIRDVMLFPGNNLRGAAFIALLMTVSSFLGSSLNFPVFKNWIGCAIATVFLFFISYKKEELYKENSNEEVKVDGTEVHEIDYISDGEDKTENEGTSTDFGS